MSSIIQPGAIVPPSQEAPFVRLADRKHVFRRRAERLLDLAGGHPLEPFLMFLGALAQAQQDALDTLEHSNPASPRPHTSGADGPAVFPVQGWTRAPLWRDLLGSILDSVESAAPAPTRQAIDRLRSMGDGELEDMARRILDGDNEALDPAAAPLVASALQTYWTHLAGHADPDRLGEKRFSKVCPVCGSAPVSSVVRVGGVEQKLRYLHCSLCESDWHLERLTCSNCECTTSLQFMGIEGSSEAVKAEACGECRSYLKILYMDRDLDVDPVADDIATLALDLLMAEEGYERSGPNLLFVPGEEVGSTN
jgi:FdhE protein